MSTAQSSPGALLVGKIRRARNQTVTIACLSDYPHASHDSDGHQARRWLERQRRAVCTAARRNGIEGSTTIENGCIKWRTKT